MAGKGGRKSKFTFEYVYQYFLDQGCELLEDHYVNNLTKMKYRCVCGNIAYISFTCFKDRGQRCMKCSGHEPLTFEYVYNCFKEQGCELLETEFIKCSKKLKYRCSCGNISYILFHNFMRGHRCAKCGGNEIASYQEVYDYFKKYGYKLLEKTYINSSVKMKCICPHGHEYHIDYSHFKTGNRCIICRASKGEKRIWGYLYRNKFNFVYQYSFDDCRNKDKLLFDFAIFDENNDLQCLIEYDGQQHFEPVEIFGGYKIYQEQVKKDLIKTTYCIANHIPLLRITYKELKQIPILIDSFIKDLDNWDKKTKLVKFSNQELYKDQIELYNK
jgi:hypothetical protein